MLKNTQLFSPLLKTAGPRICYYLLLSAIDITNKIFNYDYRILVFHASKKDTFPDYLFCLLFEVWILNVVLF